MAKIVKLESGEYINADQIITISPLGKEAFLAHTLGFDNEWQAHSEEITQKDLQNILEVTNSGKANKVPSINRRTLKLAISALDDEDAVLGRKLGAVENSGASREAIERESSEIFEAHERVGDAKGELEDYLEKLDKQKSEERG